ncbi:MAG TPA: hypothetical protein DDX98_06005 [Bacteroidales bacterium]|nr:hypothetical protein [Bacteroidales bacterium]
MAKIEVELPAMGEGIIEATITRWLADINVTVEEDDPIVEIATDKVDSEIPAPVSGVLIKQFFSEGEIPKVGEIIAVIDDGKEEQEETVKTKDEQPTANVEVNKPEKQTFHKPVSLNQSFPEEKHPISPFIRQFARARGVSVKELKEIQGVQAKGQLTKNDIYEYIKAGRPYRDLKTTTQVGTDTPKYPSEDYQPREGEELLVLDRTRSLIAEHMVRSVQIAPHVTSFVEADITALVNWRNNAKQNFKEKEGVNLTYTPILVEAVIQALKEFPRINASLLQNNKLILKKYIHIGIATALPDNNLIVPVVKHADRLSLSKLALAISDLTSRARTGELKPSEITGGTFTITNLGMTGNISGTPIINQPESAILAVGAIKKKPGVVNNNGTLSIGIRDILTLSLSYDHRIVDGALGGAFLSRIGELLENYSPPKSY